MIRKGTSDELTGLQKKLLTDYLDLQLSKRYGANWVEWMLQDIRQRMNDNTVSKESKASYREIIKIKETQGQVKVISKLDISLLNTLLQFTYFNECKPEETDENGKAFCRYIRNIVEDRNDIAHEPEKDVKFLHKAAMDCYTNLSDFIGYLKALGWDNGDEKERAYVTKYERILENYFNDNLSANPRNLEDKYIHALEEPEMVSEDEKSFLQCEANAEAGDISSKYECANCYWEGKGVEKNKCKALRYYLEVKLEGDDVFCNKANEKIRELYLCNINSQKNNENNSSCNEELRLGLFYRDCIPPQGKMAIIHFEKATLNGDPSGYLEVAYMFEKGRGGVDIDYTKALTYFKKAIELGSIQAYRESGKLYYRKKDYRKALDFFILAAAQENGDSMVNISVMYERGECVEKNVTEAKKWYQIAKAFNPEHQELQL